MTMARPTPHPRDAALLVLSVVLLAGAGLDRMTMRPSRDATAYHARVRAVYEAVPRDLGDWHGTDVPEPAEAIDMLKPNVLLSRYYRDAATGREATFLLVQCSDVRDLITHYPPICYRNQGMSYAVAPAVFNWDVEGLKIEGTEYQFESSTLQNTRLTDVYNFMVLPDGSVFPDMEAVKKYLSLDSRYFGMAQVQIVFDGVGGTAEVAVNDQALGGIDPHTGRGAFEITKLLDKNNELCVEVTFEASSRAPGGLWAPVAIEIHAD